MSTVDECYLMPGHCRSIDQIKIDLALVKIHPHYPHLDLASQPVHPAAALSPKLVSDGIKMIVVAAQRGDMHQSFDVDIFDLDEQAEGSNARDDTFKHLPDLIHHILALEPIDGVAGRLIGPPLGHRTMLSEELDLVSIVAESLRRSSPQQVANGPVDQKIRITPDG